MSFIEDKLMRIKAAGEKSLIIYLTAGDPDIESSLEYFLCAATSGADLLEVGIPFSDPMADGPVIQRAFKRSLDSGTTVRKVLRLTKEIRKNVDIPIVAFGYLNPILSYGTDRFFRDSRASGVDGVLIVDVPYEEGNDLRRLAGSYGLDWIGLVAPTSGEERIRKIATTSRGFVYVISVTGITGTRKRLPKEYMESVGYAKKEVDRPVIVGFGISTPEVARNVAKGCDGVVIGSACVRIIEEHGHSRERALKKLSNFIGKTKTRLINAAF